jgi:hypothetical protein
MSGNSALFPSSIMMSPTPFILFRAVSETLPQLGKDPKRLGAQIGAISVLHTWGQALTDHPHIHCIIPGGTDECIVRNAERKRQKPAFSL